MRIIRIRKYPIRSRIFSTYESMKGVNMQRKFTVRDEISTSLGKKMSDNETETSLMAIDTKKFWIDGK